MIAGCLQQYLHAKLGGWGAGGLGHIAAEDLTEYERCFMRQAAPAATVDEGASKSRATLDVQHVLPSVHAACEDYRASAWTGIDTQHDKQSRAGGQRLQCQVLAAWGEKGVVARLFDVEGLWRAASADAGRVRGVVVPGVGHFIPEEAPEFTAKFLLEFFK
jgi:haloacetate dehalogenase